MTSIINAIVTMTGSKATAVQNSQIWLAIITALLVYSALYVLRSIGLYVLAKRQGVKKAYLAWIPCIWLYTLCKVLGNARIFNQPVQSFALLMTILFSVAEVLTFVYGFLLYFPLLEYAIIGGETLYIGSPSQFGNEFIQYVAFDGNTGIFVTKQIYPFGMKIATLDKILTVIDYIVPLFDLASIFITISLYFALFRKYWPQHYMLVSLLSIFITGLFPIFMFVIRKKNPIDFNEYLRSRYGAYQNPYGRPYNPYGNPYGNQYGNPYGAQGGQSAPQEPDSPFEDFEDKKNKKPSEPFEEFSDKKAKNKDPFDEFDN